MADLPKGSERGAAAQTEQGGLVHYLRPINVWALSFGCILGWGAFVMPGTQLLPKAGPWGVVIAMVISAAIIAIIAANFHYLLNKHPDSGGAFAFTRRVFGHDHAFLCAWASILAYVSIMWANATAFALIARFLFGPVFQVGFLYQVAGYDVYLGEVLLTLAVLVIFGLLSQGSRKVMNALNTFLALVLIFGSAACLYMVVTSQVADFAAFDLIGGGEEFPGFGGVLQLEQILQFVRRERRSGDGALQHGVEARQIPSSRSSFFTVAPK